ncbi:hypothetical protein G6F49_011124 [Rhizopus delemar]|nr:hypothetical protein G6F49_011124 [Rhizopus delemar]
MLVLCYADDVICFLKDPTDLNVLLDHLSLYARASNAQVNYHKTLAISLSGASIATSSIWRGPLLAHHITQWHDCTSSLPAVYLGFPLCSSTSQRNRFLALLLEKIQKACQIHSQRALSIRGRVTILNSLILSKLWHVLRLTTVPKQFLGQVRSVMSSFLTYCMFPKISFSTMCLPRHAGGLEVLDPGVQQGALQLRWLTPLLSNVPVGPLATFWTSKGIRFSIVLARLADYLLHCLEDLQASSPYTWPLADYRSSFLFSDLRPPSLRGLDSPFALLFGAIDILPADYQQVVPSANTCLQLPVSACLRTVTNTPLTRSLRQLSLSSPYIRDIDSNLLRPRTAMEFHVHPYLSRKFLRLVRQNHILLAPFLVRPFIPVQYASLGTHPFTPDLTSAVDASPFLFSRKLITVDDSRRLNSVLFRRLCILPNSGPKVLFLLTPDGWHQLWKIPLSHSCRNVCYRLLHHKLPTRSNLHRLLPSIFPSPTCLNCPDQEETLEHFLYLCPPKLLVWQSMWNAHFPTQCFSSFSVAHALFQLNFPPISSSSFDISSAAIIGHTLLSVWRAHWAFIFDNIPIQTSVILNSSKKFSRQLHHETLVQKSCSHRALPHWSFV